MDLSKLRTDDTKTEEGVWVPLDPTTSIKVKYTDTLAYRRAMNAAFKPYRNVFKTTRNSDEAIPAGEQEEIAIRLIVNEVLVDWKGIKEGENEIPYSKDEARRLLKIKAFRDMVEAAAADISNFRAEEVKDDAKN